jgi:vacuolar-type H+-ATPase subunit I/STV1
MSLDNTTEIKENHVISLLDPNVAKFYSIGEIAGGIAYVMSSELSNIESQLSYIQTYISQLPVKPNHCQDKIISLSHSVKNLRKITRELAQLIRHNENEPMRLTPLGEILEKVSLLTSDRFKIHGVNLEVQNDKKININCREYQIIHAIVALLGVSYSHLHNEKEAWVKIIDRSNEQEAVLEIYESHKKNENIDYPVIHSIESLIADNTGKLVVKTEAGEPLFIITFPVIVNPYLSGPGCEK